MAESFSLDAKNEDELLDPSDPNFLAKMAAKLNRSEEEKKLAGQVEEYQSPEQQKARQETADLLGGARALMSGVSEFGKEGAGEKFAKRTEGLVEKSQQQPLKELQAKLAAAKGKRMEEFGGGIQLADLQKKLTPSGSDRVKYELRTGIDPDTGKRSVMAFNPYNPQEPGVVLAENPAVPGQFKDPTTGDVYLLNKELSQTGNPTIQQVTGKERNTIKAEEGQKLTPSEAWVKIPPAVKKDVNNDLKEYRKITANVADAKREVDVVYRAMKEYMSQPEGKRNAQLLNLVKGKIPRLAGEKGPLAVFDIQMYSGNQAVYNRVSRFLKTLVNGEATEQDMIDNFGMLEVLSKDMNKHVSRKLKPYRAAVDMKTQAYGVTADDLLGDSPSTDTEETIVVNWKGGRKKILKSRLQDAINAGATLVEGL